MSEPHRRTVVSALTPDVLGEIYEVRMYMESLVLRAAIPQLTDEDFAELKDLVEQLDRESDHRQWLRFNDRFHDALYRRSGKEFVCSLIRQLRQSVERYVWSSGRALRRTKEANAEHWRILEACRARDVNRAQEELRKHLSATLVGLTRTLHGA